MDHSKMLDLNAPKPGIPSHILQLEPLSIVLGLNNPENKSIGRQGI